jgi:hypothetical protein
MNMARKISMDTKETQAVNVLLAYDNPRTCSMILGMFNRISSQLRDKTLFKVNAFNFILLESMDPGHCATGGAGTPELALVAFGGADAPGAALLSWLENWAESRAGKEAALGLLPLGHATSAPVRRFVRIARDIATRHGLGFIYDAESQLKLLQEHCTVAV